LVVPDENGTFEYRAVNDRKVLVYWENRLVVTLANDKARRFLRQVEEAGADQQLVMARFTGNFRRGNERVGKNTPKGRDRWAWSNPRTGSGAVGTYGYPWPSPR
jgi:hypothetical protein